MIDRSVILDVMRSLSDRNVVSLMVAGAVFIDVVVVCGMSIGNVQFASCVIILLGAMVLMGVVSLPTHLIDSFDYKHKLELDEVRDLIKAVAVDLWDILLFGCGLGCAESYMHSTSNEASTT